MKSLFYTLVPSAFGILCITWRETELGLKIHRLFLPSEQTSVGKIAQMTFTKAVPSSHPAITELSGQIQRFLEGEAINFELNVISLEECSEFQRRVLLAECNIPRGWVSTYKGIAKSLGIPDGARAVGRALACNPFPIIIPCHRTIRSNGELGGFRGGLKLKRALLELEGVGFSQDGRVITNRIYY